MGDKPVLEVGDSGVVDGLGVERLGGLDELLVDSLVGFLIIATKLAVEESLLIGEVLDDLSKRGSAGKSKEFMKVSPTPSRLHCKLAGEL